MSDTKAREYAERFMLSYPMGQREREMNAAIEEAVTQHYLAGYEQAISDAAGACKDYAHSGSVSMMRRQVAYACETRVRALAATGGGK